MVSISDLLKKEEEPEEYEQILIFDEPQKPFIELPPGSEVLQVTKEGVIVRLPGGKIRILR